ncbi:MAG: hypothetical protein ACRENI_11215 [Gemmatimonadaceae bacterium]
MSQKPEKYVKPAVIQLEYETDLTVSLQGCKTAAGAGQNGGGCGGIDPTTFELCSTIGS